MTDDGTPADDTLEASALEASALDGSALEASALEDSRLRQEAEQRLRDLAGPQARLRDAQWTAIRALVADHQRALGVPRTGWGESAAYFPATALLRARGAGPSVIVSPLIALMRNQIEAA